MGRLAVRFGAAALVAALTGCAGDPARLPVGVSRAEALQRLGTPTAVYPRPGGGERLQYSRQPAGFEVSDVDIDAAARVVAVTQVMDEGRFSHDIQVDVWRVADVLFTYGPPEERSRVGAFDGEVWQWRYLRMNAPRLLYIYIDPQGVVRRYHVGDDLRHTSRGDRD